MQLSWAITRQISWAKPGNSRREGGLLHLTLWYYNWTILNGCISCIYACLSLTYWFVASLQDADSYIHRSGRTGRAGRQGTCICFYKHQEENALCMVEHHAVSVTHRFFILDPQSCGGDVWWCMPPSSMLLGRSLPPPTVPFSLISSITPSTHLLLGLHLLPCRPCTSISIALLPSSCSSLCITCPYHFNPMLHIGYYSVHHFRTP